MPGEMPISPLRTLVQDRLKTLPHYENLDLLGEFKAGRKGRYADHAFDQRKVIIEQKEFIPSSAHVRKGKNLERFINGLTRKYGLANQSGNRLLPGDKDELRHLTGRFLDNVKDKIHDADEQLRSTKTVLEMPDAVGVTLINFDTVPGIVPQLFGFRAQSALDLQSNGVFKYGDTDIVLAVCRLTPHFTISGGRLFGVASVVRNNHFERNLRYARQIRGLFREPGVRHYPNLTRLASALAIRQTAPSVFASIDDDEA